MKYDPNMIAECSVESSDIISIIFEDIVIDSDCVEKAVKILQDKHANALGEKMWKAAREYLEWIKDDVLAEVYGKTV